MQKMAALLILLLFLSTFILFKNKSPGPVVLVGGGDIPLEAKNYFIMASGGSQAKIVVIPTASYTPWIREHSVDHWRDCNITWVQSLDPMNREEANSDEFCCPIMDATGVWVSGGDQARLSSIIIGTKLERELKAFHKRGGVIGGTSAGASFMSYIMIGAGEARGLGILDRYIIDQHFSNRGRLPRLRAILNKNPGLIGLGIDEDTAIIIRRNKFQTVGSGKVTLIKN